MRNNPFNDEELQKILDHAGSWKRFKEMLGLDDKEMKALIIANGLSQVKLALWEKDYLEQELRRIGSVQLFCIIHSVKESELRSKAKSFNLDLKLLSVPVGSTSGIGRRGENFYKQVRGAGILEDCFETRGHTAPFDFRDSTYGLVNVKTGTRDRYKAKTRKQNPNYWHFSTSGWKDCDFLALVPLDPDGNPHIIVMVPHRIELSDLGRLILTGKDLLPSSGLITPIHPLVEGIGSPIMYMLLTDRLMRSRGIETKEVFEMRETISQ